MASPILREKLAAGEFFVAPGLQDMVAATIANKVGFDIVYGTGFCLTASCYGLPDAGIASYTQMLDRMETLVRTSDGAVIADADTGYGGLLNVHHTVRGYEAAGVTAIQLEDQEFPKKCGHTPFKRLVSREDMVEKIKVAVAAREDSENFLIVARTDAIASEGIDGALRRAEAYQNAGADILFVEAPESEEDMRKICATLEKPNLANIVNAGLTPALPAEVLKEIGYAFAIYPVMPMLVAAAAMETAMRALKATGAGDTPDAPAFDFKEFCARIGFDEVWAFEKKWAK